MSTLPRLFITYEEYCALEEKADFKSEYYQGEIFAMSGGTLNRARIAARTHRPLRFEVAGINRMSS